ncbi:MAG: carotenoid oxygenase family protein, partial [Caulobacteraceae bacterium]
MPTDPKGGVDRRALLGGAVLGAGALAAGAPAAAEVRFPKAGGGPFGFGAGGAQAGAVPRSENDLSDCEVEGKLPADLDGAFYRVQPDPQYPPKLGDDIAFNGDG